MSREDMTKLPCSICRKMIPANWPGWIFVYQNVEENGYPMFCSYRCLAQHAHWKQESE